MKSRRACAALLAAALFVLALRALPADLYRPEREAGFSADYIEPGEGLIHGLPAQAMDSSFLPLSSVAAAAVFSHSPPGAWRYWRIASGCAAFSLILALACLLGSFLQGLTAVGLLLFFTAAWHGQYGYPHSILSLLVLTVAGFSVWYSRSPSTLRGLLLGLALGTTLVFRSTLLFFPLLFAGWAWAFWRPRRLSLAILCVVPYLFMLPWIGFNQAVHHRFIPLEDGEARRKIIDGALGLGWNGPGENKNNLFAEGLAGSSTGKVLAWAAAETFRHPLRYVAGYRARLSHAYRLQPLLFLAAALGLFVNAGRREAWSLGLLAAYYLLIHCFMGIADRYFDPLWPLLAVMAASCLPRPKASEPARRPALVVFGVSLASCMLACLWTFKVLGTYARAAPSLEAEARRYPGCSWVLSALGGERLAQGDLDGGIADLSKAAVLRPDKLRDPLLAWAWAMKGKPDALLAWELPSMTPYRGDYIAVDALLLKAHASLRLGRSGEASRFLRKAFVKSSGMTLATESAGRALAGRADLLLEGRPAPERAAFRRQFTQAVRESGSPRLPRANDKDAFPNNADLWIDRSVREWEGGRKAASLKSADRAEGLRPGHGGDGLRLVAQDHARAKRVGLALELLTALTTRYPDDAALWLERSDLAQQAGDKASFLACLARAEEIRPEREGLSRLVRAYAENKGSAKALETAKTLTELFPKEAGAWIDRAALARLAGDEALSASSLARAESFKPAEADLRRIALGYQDLGRCDLSLKILGGLARTHPQDAALLSDKGLCEQMTGASAAAIEDLQKAISLDPSRLPGYLTLGFILVEQGRPAQAVSLYDAALRLPSTQKSPLLPTIRESRAHARTLE